MKPALSLVLAVILVLTLFTGCTAENTGISAKRIFDIDHPNDDYKTINASFTIPDIPNVIFTFDRNTLIANDEMLSDAYGCSAVYTADVTGDGLPELCLNISWGSGHVVNAIKIVDYTTQESIFLLADSISYDHYFFVRDGILCVQETRRNKGELVRTGILVNDESGINVLWDEIADNEPDMVESALLPVDMNKQTVLKTVSGSRYIDVFHPDDSEKNQFFTATLDAFPNVDFTNDRENGVSANGTHLVGDFNDRCSSVYLADFTGDGTPELCFGMSYNRGIYDNSIIIYDYITKKEIFAYGQNYSYSHYFFLRDGTLCVKEVDNKNDEIIRTGILAYGDNGVTIVWEKEINAKLDRD